MNHHQYLKQMKEKSKLNNGGFNKWLEILTGEDLPTKLRKSEKVELKFSASNGTAKATLSTRDKGYIEHKYVQRQQQSTTITLQTKPTKTIQQNAVNTIRNETDEERQRWKLTVKPFTVKIIFFDATISSRNDTINKTPMRKYLSNGLRTATTNNYTLKG